MYKDTGTRSSILNIYYSAEEIGLMLQKVIESSSKDIEGCKVILNCLRVCYHYLEDILPPDDFCCYFSKDFELLDSIEIAVEYESSYVAAMELVNYCLDRFYSSCSDSLIWIGINYNAEKHFCV